MAAHSRNSMPPPCLSPFTPVPISLFDLSKRIRFDRLLLQTNYRTMKLVTVSQAKSRLSSYIKSAQEGEDVVIMRGSKPAVVLRPISEKDLNLTPELSPSTLADFEAEITRNRKNGSLLKLGSGPAQAIATLNHPRGKRK